MNMYKPRITDIILRKKLKGKGAVLIEGPKWCGKTTTAEQIAKSILYMSKPEDVKSNIMAADINPSILLEGPTPRLIDEWQIAPKLWDAIRHEVDHRGNYGNFILTGSSVPPQNLQPKGHYYTLLKYSYINNGKEFRIETSPLLCRYLFI